MIPKQELFGSIEPLSGSIDEIISQSNTINVDYVYSNEKDIHEVMTELSCTKEEAINIINNINLRIIQECLNELIADGRVVQDGVDADGNPLYSATKRKSKKKNKKK